MQGLQNSAESGDRIILIQAGEAPFAYPAIWRISSIKKSQHMLYSFYRWKLEPSQTVVQVKEGNTALPAGSLSVKGYDVAGSITSFGSPISGIYVLLYSKEVCII